jgi:site-specific DNA recombinase
MKKQTNYNIGIYIRVSTQEQADNPEGSIRNQKDRLEQMVQLKNLQENFGEIKGVFIDEAKSGKDTNRPELRRMLKEIESGEINLVMASELSRISRNIQDFAKIWNLMKDRGCSFLSLRENFDTTTAAGEMVLYTLANLSQFERRQVSERVSANFLARAKRGLSNGGNTPPGLKVVVDKPGYLEIDEEEAPVVRKCFEYFLAEETLAATAKRLNRENYQLKGKMSGGKPRLKHFSVENLYRMLTNPAVAGLKSYTENGKTHRVKAVWRAIVSEDVFNEVAQKLKANKHFKKGYSKKRYPYILSGLVYCLECGDKLTGKSAHGKGGKVGYYEHGWRYRKNF